MTEIAPTATVDKTAQLGQNVTIGPGCVIEKEVVIGDDCTLRANVMVCEGTIMGRYNRIFANCVLGDEPQILNLENPKAQLIIGDHNTIRENVTINRGSPHGGGRTVVGNNNLLMIGTHLGHDCLLEDNIVISNYTQIGGHCKIERNAWLSSICGTHQFVTIGKYTYVAGLSGVTCDMPPFMRVSGAYPCEVRGLNAIGLQRGGFSEDSIKALNQIYRRLYRHRQGSHVNLVSEILCQNPEDENVRYLLEFLLRSFQHRFGRYQESLRH
ncbi:MAG: acyl-ACP--UDP-N-acetylglucosamine O-acyltransferase [Sedimentisphaerales bacterium]|nr:acyl-ACP--UDP-N-acetylglucosamine O-acyltransferase [Sedimentisphaerales bacterium]